jgi:hypothetical protein
MKKVYIVLLFTSCYIQLFSQKLISQFNKTVAFLYISDQNEFKPYGTGFLVSIPAKVSKGNYIYLVTAKHVLQNPKKENLNRIFARFNTRIRPNCLMWI